VTGFHPAAVSSGFDGEGMAFRPAANCSGLIKMATLGQGVIGPFHHV